MNKTVLITVSAQNDILQISEYISKDNKSAALVIIDSFYKTFELISEFPSAGAVKNSINDKNVRIYTIKKKFNIVYRIIDNKIEILRILTKYQNIFAVLK